MAVAANYYYNLLNKEHQRVYYALKEGLSNLQTSFPVPRIDGRELADVYFLLRLDHPELFYSVNYSFRYYPDSSAVEMIPEYMFEKKKVKEHQQAMEARIKKLVRPAEKLDEKGKELYIHDFICQNITYDKLKKAYSHEIIGALGNGVAVCEGIAKAVKILCDRLGIWCIIAISGNNPEKGIKYRHAWNVIKIGGQYYHLDATFDNTVGKKDHIRYDYFNLNDKQLFRDHEPVLWQVPACTDGSKSYYQEKKLSFTKMEDVRKRSAQAVKKGKVLTFHWRGGYFTREIFDEMLHIFREEAAKKQKHAYVSVNWPQAVLRIEFKEDSMTERVIMQEANEGEQYDPSNS